MVRFSWPRLTLTLSPSERGPENALLIALLVALVLGCGTPADHGLPSDQQLDDVFRRLHEPLYRTFEAGVDRERLHDLLAGSLTGEALTREYVEQYSTARRMVEESTAVRVLRVDYQRVEVVESEPTGAWIDADWSVGGVVTHQGHRHIRTNRYRALYQLQRQGEDWRIVTSRMRDMRRVGNRDAMAIGDDGSDGSDEDPEDESTEASGAASSKRGMMSPLELLRAGMGEELDRSSSEADNNDSETDGD